MDCKKPILKGKWLEFGISTKAYDTGYGDHDIQQVFNEEDREMARKTGYTLVIEKSAYDQLMTDAKAMAEALALRTEHDTDCFDAGDVFGPNETCECGAVVARYALTPSRRERFLK